MAEFVKKIRTASGDLPIDYNALANLPALNAMFSNPNLLINSDFRNPVNQRGQVSYSNTTDWSYCYNIDRWACNGSLNTNTVTVNTDSITVTNNATSEMQFRQWFDTEADQYCPNGTYTISVNVLAVTGSVSIKMNETNTLGPLVAGKNVFTFSGTPLFFSFNLASKASVKLEYAKLECGAISTPFVPRLYQDELLVCRRYYRNHSKNMFFPQVFANQYCGYLFDTPMRKDPTVRAFSMAHISDSSAVGASVEAHAQGVFKFVAIQGYNEKAVIVPMLELDAEIY